MKYLILIAGILANASASILIKYAVSNSSGIGQSFYQKFLLNPTLIGGVILYGVAFLLYTIALSKFPLNIAHPLLTSGSIAMVAFASVVGFGEKMSYLNMIGVLLIIIGVIALTVR
ncbi:multidrug transporter [Enterovibrio norvegicus]|uniref:DMT family transporter n=1 Tax=Enterovibrio norvegicus TaxID=188144 RepID=UPI00037E6E9C|nr:hypothetical protein [Enterovibrio norvegicus]OEE68516.1 multidrug transporter [Enterovibrio norvegicus]